MKAGSNKQLAVGRWRRAAKTKLPSLLIARCVLTSICVLIFAASVDAAGEWTRQRAGSLAWLHAVYFLDENRGWAVGGRGALLATVDGGDHWSHLSRPTEDALRDVYFSDEQNGWLVCERSIYDLKTKEEPRTYLLRTTDGGATWQQINVIGKDVDARLVRALFTNEGRGWAFGEEGALYTTRDGGTNWERQRVPTRNLLLGGWFLDAEQGWLVGAGATLLQTSDGGETWRAGALLGLAPLPGADSWRVRFTAASFVNKRRGWAVGAEGQIFATNDGGRTWVSQRSNISADLNDVKFLDELEGWAAGAHGTLIHTTDGGARWVSIPSGTTHALERLWFVGRNNGWVVGFGGTILRYIPTAAPLKTPGLRKL